MANGADHGKIIDFRPSVRVFPNLLRAIGYQLYAISFLQRGFMVTILVLGHTLRDAVGESDIEIGVTAPTTVKKLVESNPDQLGGLLRFLVDGETLITVNKRIGSEDSPVKDGDVVKFSFQSRASYDGTRDIPT
jgi:molybdopterin synthase sulfur carrier subunit